MFTAYSVWQYGPNRRAPTAVTLGSRRQQHQIALLAARSNSGKPATGYLGSGGWLSSLQAPVRRPPLSSRRARGRLIGCPAPCTHGRGGRRRLDHWTVERTRSALCVSAGVRSPPLRASSTKQGRPDGTSSQHQHSKQRHGPTAAAVDWTLGFNLG